MNNTDNFIKVGQIIAAHGINGQFIVRSFTDPIQQIFSYDNLYNSNYQIFKIKKKGIKISKGREQFICNSPELKSRNEVDLVMKSYIYTSRIDFKATSSDEFYQIDLLNCDVALFGEDKVIARVISMQNYGAGDIVEIEFLKSENDNNTKKENTIMIPFNKYYINEVDLASRKIFVTLPNYA